MDPGFIQRLEKMRAGIPSDASMLRQYTNKGFLFSQHEESLQGQEKYRREQMSYHFQQSMSTGLKSSINSKVPLNVENRVDISTICKNTDTILNGKYFLCRTLAPPFKMTSLMTVVEDPEGDKAVRLALYNFSFADWKSMEALCEELPVGQCLVITNPWFKSTQDGGFSIRCDNPGDVIFFSQQSFQETFPKITWKGEIPNQWRKYIKKPAETALEWKNEGNTLFLKTNYEQAIVCYTTSLSLKPSQEIMKDVLSNRAFAYMALRCFRTALKDLEKLLTMDPSHMKGNYRKAKCLIGLQVFSEAITFIENLTEKNDANFRPLLESAKSQHLQQMTGKYDIMKLYSGGEIVHEDIADFCGPVRKKLIPGKGRGLVAEHDIAAGQLILVSKAFDIVFPNPKDDTLQMNFNLQTNFINSPGHELLIKTMAQRLKFEPELGTQLYELYAGPDFPLPRTEDSINKNLTLDLDIRRIDAICTYNAFSGYSADPTKRPQGKDYMTFGLNKGESTGLWIMPSFINHSCWDCNCRWSTYGDIMFIRAFKPIKEGEEILISYINAQQDPEERRKMMDKHSFVCKCQLCILDFDTTSEGLNRRALLKKISDMAPPNKDEIHTWKPTQVKQVSKLIDQVNRLKLNVPQVNPSLFATTFALGHYYFERQDFQQSLDVMLQCYSMTTTSQLTEAAVQAANNVIMCLIRLNKIEAAKKWVKKLKEELMICYGTVEMAKNVSPNTMTMLGQLGISF